MRLKLSGLWKHPDFLRLWSGQTISVFGSMIGGTAMSFTAILFLKATPFQMGVLQAMQIVPGFLIGLFAGAWVDRLRRRPLMIGADLGRGLILATIPIAALFRVLHIEQVFGVALFTSILTVLFNLAYQTYLPSLVGKDNVVEGNSKLSASAAAAEFGGFSIAGWLVQIFTAPITILIDAISFVISAVSVLSIRTGEAPITVDENPNMRREIVAGLKVVIHNPLLFSSAAAILFESLSSSIFGALVVLYMSRDLGFSTGILGMIWAIGGISSFVAAAFAPRITKYFGVGTVMIGGLFLFGVSELFIPLASGATLLSAIFLILQQLGDGFYVIYDINLLSLRQNITDERLLGRVNATMNFISLGAALIGTMTGGILGSLWGVRPTLFLSAVGTFLAALTLVISPIRTLEKLMSEND